MDYLRYHYEELLKLLVILSKDYEIQLIAYTEDELAIDFENELIPNTQKFIDEGYFSEEVISLLLEIDHFFETRSGQNYNGFWSGIETHPDWGVLREMAKNILVKLGMDKLEVNIDAQKEYDQHRQVIAMKVTIELDESNL
ncbi:hypothetical protein [Pseudoalteromonas luteoviolacea]|uniref:hypothetical protein n=1 Tax=Pseudoalteromonas luteoviolacea TaxID=43657 RepID=UPI000A9624B3|nr:hypothetical protein [Pseudoalteromonas luteoviolacea]